jgi:hypothetical protein
VEPFAPDVHLRSQYLLRPDMRGVPAVPVLPRGSLAHRRWVWVNLFQSLARLRFSLRKNLRLAVLIDSPGFHDAAKSDVGITRADRSSQASSTSTACPIGVSMESLGSAPRYSSSSVEK